MRIYKIWYIILIYLCFIRNKKVKPQKNPNVVDYQIFVYLQLSMVSNFPQYSFIREPKIESCSCEKIVSRSTRNRKHGLDRNSGFDCFGMCSLLLRVGISTNR